ncbi:MAG: class I SAM-dependent methyltransferase [Chloroflexota bacterium]
MSPEVIARLNRINKRFYEVTAAHFDATRQQPWPGWEQLLPHLPAERPLRVLDVGCGNGRFGLFLAERLIGHIHYTGLDNNAALLDYARDALAAQENVTVTLREVDVVVTEGALAPAGQFDVVVAFGVIHHVPGGKNRRRFVQQMAACVAPGRVMAFAAWRFMDNDRLRKRTVPMPDDLPHEPGDYLLDWKRGETALRYCHFVDDAEHAQLVAATGLDDIVTYRADGHDGQTNKYSVLRYSESKPANA